MCKEGKTTMEAVDVLSQLGRKHRNAFSYAGTKDKRGVTTQRCSAFLWKAADAAGASLLVLELVLLLVGGDRGADCPFVLLTYLLACLVCVLTCVGFVTDHPMAKCATRPQSTPDRAPHRELRLPRHQA